MSFFLSFPLSLSLYFWLIPWIVKAGCVTQGILTSFLLLLFQCQLLTMRFRSNKTEQNKGPADRTNFLIGSIVVWSARDTTPFHKTFC